MKLDDDSDVPSTQPPGSPDDVTHTSASLRGDSGRRQLSDTPLSRQAPRDRDRYQIVAEHGRGGLGRVSRVYDRELGRDIAIKEILSRDAISEMRFLREALITARLEHPSIVPVYEAGYWPDGTPFYAMKLVSGRSLRDLIEAAHTVDERITLLHHVIAVADAMAYAHDRNIIHRDLKPANIIVGDYGETVVIDWGLAKEVASSDPANVVDASQTSSDGLTSAGSVLGTPAYMSPEQSRGEPVDQRTDVFAIGAMLWEVCALDKVPPTDLRDRRRKLRRSGIDTDLSSIIDKSLDRDPARRYSHAGALAADLKAFKSGARIAARQYSILAASAHWARRHRSVAFAALAVLVIAIAASVLYVRGVAQERDRADQARAVADTALDELTLKHAQSLLSNDPSAAMDALQRYHGGDTVLASQIRAEALGRGVAQLRAAPHTNNVLWATGTPGHDIISLSNDGTIVRTTSEGVSVVLARDVADIGVSAYSLTRHLLAYACHRDDICLFDVLRGTQVPSDPALLGRKSIGLAFTPDGSLLASISNSGQLFVFDVVSTAHPVLRMTRQFRPALDVRFVDDHVLAVEWEPEINFVRLTGEVESIAMPAESYWDANASLHELVQAELQGFATVLIPGPVRVVARRQLCHGPMNSTKFVAGERMIVYACRDGEIGIWDPQHDQITSRWHINSTAVDVMAATAGAALLVACENGDIDVLGLQSGLVTNYKGHGFRLTFISPPTSEYPYLISGDARGGVRTWVMPIQPAKVAATSTTRFHSVIFAPDSRAAIATSSVPQLTLIEPAGAQLALQPHVAYDLLLEPSDTGDVFAAYGADIVELWSFASSAQVRSIATGQGSVSRVRFDSATGDIVTAGRDGRLIRWTASNEPVVAAQYEQPIEDFVLLPETGTIVCSLANGEIWQLERDGRRVQLRTQGAPVKHLASARKGRFVYAGSVDGSVLALDTDINAAKPTTVLQTGGAIDELVVSPSGNTVVVASNSGVIYIGASGPGQAATPVSRWLPLAERGHAISFASDRDLVIACGDGLIWLYSTDTQDWKCLATGITDYSRAATSATKSLSW